MKENVDHYVWDNIKSLEDLENTRMSAMRNFLSDYEKGKTEYGFQKGDNKLLIIKKQLCRS